MQIQKILHKDLLDYLDTASYLKSPNLPISRIRGLSQAKNPRARPDDTVLIMVFENGEMKGYLGVLPDDLHFNEVEGHYEKEHIGWLSCIWVDPGMRGKGIAKTLVNKALEAWNNRIMMTEFTADARKLYESIGQFMDLSKTEGLRAYLRPNLTYLLMAKNPKKWSKLQWLLGFFDGGLSIINNLRLLFIKKPKCKFSYVSEIDSETIEFIQKNRPALELMRRGEADLNWIINNPWLQSGFVENEESKRYHFSSVAKCFKFLNLKIFNKNNEIVAFLILAVRDKNLKIPYSYIAPEAEAIVTNTVEQIMMEQQLDMVTVFHPNLVNYWHKNKGPFFMKRKMQRHYMISKLLGELLNIQEKYLLQDGDADAAFT